MNDLTLRHVQVDEIWTYCRKKERHVTGFEKDAPAIGDIYIFVAFDEDSRLVPTFRVGKRNENNTIAFMLDLSRRLRKKKPHESDQHAFSAGKSPVVTRISTDAFPPYPGAVDIAFGATANYAQIKKVQTKDGPVTMKRAIRGQIDPRLISTSLVERNNLTIRTFMRRLVRRSVCFSKKLTNLGAATAVHFAHYNYCWRHGSLETSPAVAAGIAGRRFTLEELYDETKRCAPEWF